jgi:hypothetical protein
MGNSLNVTFTRKAGEYSLGKSPKGLFVVKYSKINGRNKLKLFHSGNYLFVRYGIKEDGKARDLCYEELFISVRNILKNPPDYDNLELFNGECLAMHVNEDDFSDSSSVAFIGIIPITQHQSVKIDVWGKDYRVVLAKDLKKDDVQDIKLRKLVRERLANSGLEEVLKF